MSFLTDRMISQKSKQNSHPVASTGYLYSSKHFRRFLSETVIEFKLLKLTEIKLKGTER